MTRGVRQHLIGFCLLATLAGCARMWVAEREPWRREAEIACLNSGAVKEGPSVAIMKSIDGPGVCGADYPLRISALGDPVLVGFADEVVRPPGAIAGAYPPPVSAPPYPPYPAPAPYSPTPNYSPPANAPGEPISLTPPPPGSAGYYDAPGAGDPREPYRPDAYPPPSSPLRQPAEVVPMRPPANPAAAIGPAAMSPAATLACPLVSKLDRYISDSVQPAALRWFGQPVVEIKQISAYSCRGMNGDPNAHISEHAFGNALDIAAFVLADGRKITVRDGWHGAPEEQGFLHDVQGAACEVFTTVLAPGSNAYHYDHMHVDLMRRASGRRICQPAAIPGEVAAARAGSRYGRSRPGEAPYTGAVAARPIPRPAMRLVPDQPYSYAHDPSLARAVPGED